MDEIHRALLDFGIPARLLGFDYLHNAIEIVAEDGNYKKDICKRLYQTVANTFGENALNVERAIRYAIETGFKRADVYTINRYFGKSVNPDKRKVTNLEFISAFALQQGEETVK